LFLKVALLKTRNSDLLSSNCSSASLKMHLLPRKTWQKITSFLSISHSVPIFIDEIEICLLAYILVLATTETIGLKVSLLSCLVLHFLRGGYRWQLTLLYVSVFITFIMSNLLYKSLVKTILMLSAIATLGLCYLIPSVPMLHGRGTPLGVQDLTFEGPNGQFWVKCFYPTRVADKEKADGDEFPSDNRGTMKLFLSLAIIMLSVIIRMYLESTDLEVKKEKEDMLSLISFYFFPIIHLIRLLYDIKYALPSCDYISTTESTQVLNGKIYIYVYIYIYMDVCVCICVFIYVYIYMYMYTCTYIWIYVHICTSI
jgi:hypothetical protein